MALISPEALVLGVAIGVVITVAWWVYCGVIGPRRR